MTHIVPSIFMKQFPVDVAMASFLAEDCRQRASTFHAYAMGCAPNSPQREAWFVESETELRLHHEFTVIWCYLTGNVI